MNKTTEAIDRPAEDVCECGHVDADHFNAGERNVCAGVDCRCDGFVQSAESALDVSYEMVRAAIINGPKHVYWGAGEPDCPRDIKAANGELHTLRCKHCDDPKFPICSGGTSAARPAEDVCGQGIQFGRFLVGCGRTINSHREVYRCYDCDVAFHKNCLKQHCTERKHGGLEKK